MECERESNSPLKHGRRPGRLHEQTTTQRHSAVQSNSDIDTEETGESVTPGRIRKRKRWDSQRASHLATSPWAQWVQESSNINTGFGPMDVWISTDSVSWIIIPFSDVVDGIEPRGRSVCR